MVQGYEQKEPKEPFDLYNWARLGACDVAFAIDDQLTQFGSASPKLEKRLEIMERIFTYGEELKAREGAA